MRKDLNPLTNQLIVQRHLAKSAAIRSDSDDSSVSCESPRRMSPSASSVTSGGSDQNMRDPDDITVGIVDDKNEMEPKTETEGNNAPSEAIPCLNDIRLQDVSQGDIKASVDPACMFPKRPFAFKAVAGHQDHDDVRDERTALAEPS